jgi:hypothetical protein
MSDQPLEKEIKTYEKHHQSLVSESEGKYVLISGEELHGVWDTYEDALKAGYLQCGLDPFMVKKISGVEEIQFFPRNVPICRS